MPAINHPPHGYDLHDLLFGSQGDNFLYVVVLRAFLTFLVVLGALRILGKRGVRQLSVFELVIILTLGSAAGDPMLYNEVGLLDAIVVFIMIVLLYRLTIYLATRSHRFEIIIKGRPAYIIEDGKFCAANFRRQPIAFDELFAELRLRGVSQLGQIKVAIIETSGELSLFFYADEEVQYGMPIWPGTLQKQVAHITQEDFYSCIKCTETGRLDAGSHECRTCKGTMWVKASNERRVP